MNCLKTTCQRSRRILRRRCITSAWSVRDMAKLIFILFTLIFFLLCMLNASVYRFAQITVPPSTVSNDRKFVDSKNPLFYRFHSMDQLRQLTTKSPIVTTGHHAVNPHNFDYTILEKDVCVRNPRPFLLTVVHTHPANHKRRMVIRETWGNGDAYDIYGDGGHFKLIVLFMMGSTDDRGLMQAIKSESSRYRDIIQEDFEDTYRNLTHKAVMWLKWVSTYCPNAAYVLKLDDDIFVNTFNLINHLRHLNARRIASSRSILCLVWHRMQVVRNPDSKWYVSKDEYPNDYFSNYCSGSAYILTGDLLNPFYQTALKTKFFWIDDFYVTGLLPRSMTDIHYHNIGSLYALKQQEVRDKLVYNNALFGHIPGSLSLRYKLWKEILTWRGIGKPMLIRNATL